MARMPTTLCSRMRHNVRRSSSGAASRIQTSIPCAHWLMRMSRKLMPARRKIASAFSSVDRAASASMVKRRFFWAVGVDVFM
jgi:hypothetical protein